MKKHISKEEMKKLVERSERLRKRGFLLSQIAQEMGVKYNTLLGWRFKVISGGVGR